jgi:hypothetical protein
MSVTVINSTSPTFTCTSYETTLDAESIDTSYVYESDYQSSCGEADLTATFSSGTSGADGADGEDGRGIVSITFLSDSDGNDTPGDPGTTDTYEILYTDDTTTTFDVTHGSNGIDGVDGTDGNTITTGSGAPSGGSDGDLYVDTDTYDLYENQSGSWSNVGNIQGAEGPQGPEGPAGTDGSDGISLNWLADSSTAPSSPSENDAYYNTTDKKSYVWDGSAWQTVVEDGQAGDQWTKGTGSPADSSVYDYDTYYLDTDANDIYYKSSGSSSWSLITSINGAKYKTTCSDSIDLSSISTGTEYTYNLDQSDMSYTVGQILVFSYSSTVRFYGRITSYSGGTSITISVIKIVGSGTYSSWDVNISSSYLEDVQSTSGKVYEINLPADTTVSARISSTTTDDYPDGWTLTDGTVGGVTQNDQDDLIVTHTLTNAACFDVKIMYETSGVWVTLTGDAAYTKLANDITNSKIELASLTNENVALKLHLIFY